MTQYPKRLIEVDLPIKKISEHARREKSIRHGHISTLHIWWARRPLAACRAVLCASLWPDPADPLCPEEFRKQASSIMKALFDPMDVESKNFNDPLVLRKALLDFIADFSAWDNSNKIEYLNASHSLTQISHEVFGGLSETQPLVVDPFAGGGSIPLETLRVGGNSFASDLNPIPVLINKVLLEYVPKYGKCLVEEVRKWGMWVEEQAERELEEIYPRDPDGSIPIAYIWSRTIKCEGPNCGAEVPLLRSMWLSKKGKSKKGRSTVAIKIIPDKEKKCLEFEILRDCKPDNVDSGTIKRGAATCPICGHTTPVTSVKKQLNSRQGGANDAKLLVVVTIRNNQQGRFYRLANENDITVSLKAKEKIKDLNKDRNGSLSLVPDENLPPKGTLGFRIQPYGMKQWGDLFTYRQSLAIITLVKFVREAGKKIVAEKDIPFATAVQTILSLAVDSCADHNSSLCTWRPNTIDVSHVFGRQALPMTWDFAETNPIGKSTGSFEGAIEKISRVLEREEVALIKNAQIENKSACFPLLPDDFAQCVFTDPPYYDSVPYADLSDFFIVWLKRSVGDLYLDLFSEGLSPKEEECIVNKAEGKDKVYFENTMRKAMSEARRVLAPEGICVVVFAHKSTDGWEAQLQAMIDAGWMITGSWPIDTELATRLRGMNSAALVSSVHLVCRPRKDIDNPIDSVGDWRDILYELPHRIHEWMSKLREEGVVGADSIFSCIGPALEVYSRYSIVEKASGEKVTLREYLEHVWGAVSKEAMNMIFEGADATGFEEDARLTAMWLWTLKTGTSEHMSSKDEHEDEEDEEDEDESSSKKSKKSKPFTLDYDTARKIAQGLGAHMEQMPWLVEINKGSARILMVEERTKYLFQNDIKNIPDNRMKGKGKQATLFNEFEGFVDQYVDPEKVKVISTGKTTLDRIHQAMLLFAAGRGNALKKLLVEEGAGRDERFWRLAQALSALYPAGSNEKRWVDGVLARKKGLGF